jgi:hypothetical protein
MAVNRIRRTDGTELGADPRLADADDPVPESDRLEQLIPVDPATDPDDGTPADPALAPGTRGWAGEPQAPGPGGLVDEADWLEQQLSVPVAGRDDEDYPPDLGDSE